MKLKVFTPLRITIWMHHHIHMKQKRNEKKLITKKKGSYRIFSLQFLATTRKDMVIINQV